MIQIELYSCGIYKNNEKMQRGKKNPREVIEGVLQDHDINVSTYKLKTCIWWSAAMLLRCLLHKPITIEHNHSDQCEKNPVQLTPSYMF